jgi:alpha-beta hydrolase superfamily lysophospholipase
VGTARLLWPTEVERPRGVVLILHGGKARSERAVRAWQAAVWRMAPFARSVAQAGDGQVTVASLRYAVRGWNAAAASPLGDAELALEQIAARYPGVPIGLLGHSMGGRVALHLGGDERVRAIAALAPWVEGRDPARWHPGLHVLVMHGTRDRVTSPKQSRAMAELMVSEGADVTYVAVEGDGHAMLRQSDRWHTEPAAFLVRSVLTAGD